MKILHKRNEVFLKGLSSVMTGRGGLERSTESTGRPSNVPRLLLAAVAIACGTLHPTLAECPHMCDCKWKSGKESVVCVNANLTKIPRKLDSSTQLLELTGNFLGAIPQDAFAEAGLLNIQKLYLAKCALRTLDRFAFRRLINLVELDLSRNALQTVPSASLETIPGLRELRLSGNPIQTLAADGFKSVPHLVRLDMSSCHVMSIGPRSFSGLESSLEWLKLDKNRLSVISSPAIAGLLGLHGLELAGNPWNCSCELRPLREWMLRRNVPSSTPPLCSTPTRLAGRSWSSIELDDFACAPSATAYPEVAATTEGGDVTLRCRIRGIPSPDVRWLWRGSRLIANLTRSNPSNTRGLFIVRTSSTGSNLTIISVEEHDAGMYVCSAKNQAGQAQANVTLHVQQRPRGDLSGRLVAGIISVAILLVVASCLVALCVCRLRKQRRDWTVAPFRPRERHVDNYEKIEMNNKRTDQSVTRNGSVSVGIKRPLRVPYNRKKDGWYRGVALTDEDEAGYEAEAESHTTLTRAHVTSTDSAWTTGSKYTPDEVPPPHKTWNQRPDSLRCGSAVAVSNIGPASQHRISREHSNDVAAAIASGLPQHVLRKQVLSGSGGSLYTSLLSTSEEISSSDLHLVSPLHQEGTSQTPRAPNDPATFFTVPRRERKSTYQQPLYGSESPLLADSHYGSSGGSSNSSHRAELPSISSGSGIYYPRASSLLSLTSPSDIMTSRKRGPSLPSSPTESSSVETPILNALGRRNPAVNRVSYSSGSVDTRDVYEGRSSQLDKFLNEYQRLHDQLSIIKETYESVSHRNYYARVPRSILKNKNTLISPESSVLYSRNFPPYWVSREELLRRLNGNDVLES